MACFKPLSAWQSKTAKTANGKGVIFFSPPKLGSKSVEFVQLPCGRCIGCRLERSRQWAVRCMHEAQLHEENCFITLTFDDENINEMGTLVKRDFQKFMKRLRKKFQPKKIRFLHAGEYGEITQRPHHHALLFGVDFPDKRLIKERNGNKVYSSRILEQLWPYGFHEIGSLTFESAAYVARYCCKKQDGKNELITKEKHKKDGRLKEYNTQSRRPGLGRDWLKKYGSTDVWPQDSVVMRGIKMKPPKYYTSQYELTNPEEAGNIKLKRKEAAAENENNRWERLPSREKCATERFKQLKRSL